MDGATVERIVGIVKNMQAGGMSEKDITDNLRQMGLAGDELNSVLDAVGLSKPAPPVLQEPATTPPEEHFERLHTTVAELHDKQDALREDFSEISKLRKELADIKTELDEIKPLLAALKRMNENLMDINRKMLAKLATK